MSTLERTINLLNIMQESQIEIIYHFAQFLNTQSQKKENAEEESVDTILGNIVGVLSDTGKTVEDYRKERIGERYGLID